ncbi:MAG: signal recognition particle-docking protein FtsY [Candidatus Diapherotrites archaeon]
MFDALKKKISSFTSKLKETSEEAHEVPEKREIKAKVSLGSSVKSIVTGHIHIGEKDLKDLLWELELSLLEADVEQGTAQEITSEIHKELVGTDVPRNEFDSFVKKKIKESLARVMQAEKVNILEKLSEKKPLVILFLGPNGAGKTTTIAKIAHLLQKNGKKVILAASDTFRAASIEQLETHASRLGVRLVKHNYGSDPAAVAFDAVKAAEAKGFDAVLIDSAGRQDTNKNLMRELEKISRVVKPDLKIFIGEALSGQNLLNQASEFDKALGLDGFILTKIDTDAKGGTTISLIYKLKKPVLFVGTGQEYDDLLEFTPEYVIDRVV